MKSHSSFTCKAASAMVALGALVCIACTPMAAMAHSVSAHGGNKGTLYTLFYNLGL